MRKKRTKRISVPRRRPSSRRAVRSGSHLKTVLILQCNPEKLESQGFSFSDTLERTLATFLPTVPVKRIRGTTKAGLLQSLGECHQAQGSFDMVAVETHSDHTGLRLTADCRPSWAELASWLAPLKPRLVIIAGCQAGRWLPTRALFAGLPTLKELYGSPVLTSEKQVAAFQFLVPYLLKNGRIKAEHRQLMQLAQFGLNGGVIVHHTRADFRRGVEEGILWTFGEQLLRRFLGR